jgi:hypothetical protein
MWDKLDTIADDFVLYVLKGVIVLGILAYAPVLLPLYILGRIAEYFGRGGK